MTTYSLRRQALVPLAGLLGLIVTFGAPALTATEQDEKVLFLTAVDQNGKSITDLKTEEVLIREDNQEPHKTEPQRTQRPRRRTNPIGIFFVIFVLFVV